MHVLHRLLRWHFQLPRRFLELPWRETLTMFRQRFREDHLALTASSLTLTTLTAMVPFFAVMLSVFTAFPVFARLQLALEQWMVQNLIPDAIASQVSNSITTFAGHARELGTAGTFFFILTAFFLMSNIDTQFNAIWRVRKRRPLAQSVLVYWAVITIGPVVLGASIATTSYILSLSQGWVTGVPEIPSGSVKALIDLVEFALMSIGFGSLYYFVPNTRVRTAHACAGGVFTAAGLALAQRLLGLYLARVPSYSVIYGTFATLPILLLWMYMAWLIVLLGAVIAAYLPSLLRGPRRHGQGMAWQMQLAVEALRELVVAHATPQRGLSVEKLAAALEVEAPQLEPVLEELAALRWVGRLDEKVGTWVLLVPPDSTPVAPLVARWLLPPTPELQPLWQQAPAGLTLSDALGLVPMAAASGPEPVTPPGLSSPAPSASSLQDLS
ncbi:YihY family inner membrane protein [Brachymonas sp. M4Q-1]|uniref:YihY family inner membrane protein n=1 Tax=Brachymonas sp. M4Q-1 TaxID=3416906 RepID=UPI003CF345A3